MSTQVMRMLVTQGPHFSNDSCIDGFQGVLPGDQSRYGILHPFF